MPPSRREKLEAMLQTSPDDTFLLYGLALEHLREGAKDEGIRQLKDLIARDRDYQAAYFQLAQGLVEQSQTDEARTVLQQGIAAANRTGNSHAAGEMESFLMSLS